MTHTYRLSPIDLFGEVVVTLDDLEAWVAAVSPLHLTDRMFDNYVRSYEVAGKVRWAKLRGEFEERTAWNAHLALMQIL